ncbi:Methyltransferase domain-containing protein [Deinococcus reticulitermitis]|uniref:site-specific DNA-methyltransferase (adenine-specific) n=1 Tax=Deinococcus reticulitermitis TaxID=856736 RepID=A0A1H7BQG4_9DEIO|nr:DNA methyltransferase [Deinococcus reticulitermitis]SEJ79446.1 Methyltransferase domain-containing protein [Deinococcus reticulitermitis]
MSATQLHHVRVHGLGLTDDFLLQLSDRAQTARLEGSAPASYDLPPRTSLEEAIQDAWDDARKAWLKSQQHGTDTWAGWVRPLLKALDYSFPGGGVTGGKYAVNHLSETGDVPLHFTKQADLDRVTDETGLRVSPHGLMQGYLNATPGHLWGLVTNGETLRLLRDNAQVTRPAYVEFQIGEMLRAEDARAFRVLWLLLHRTRLRGGQGGTLERWNEASKELGQRANDTLRDGVQLAIEHLGTGFLHRNPALLEATRSGAVTPQDLYRACLRTVYQMVFLFVTEDRDLLFERNDKGEYVADAVTRARAAHLLTRALRQKAGALTGSAAHTDAYQGWETLLTYVRGGFAPLGLPALGSLLFSPTLLSGLKLGNDALYAAVRALSEIRVGGSLRPVNYAGLDSEELGSIYESLLELVPRVESGPRFSLTLLPGNERKSTGSYYTPAPLIGLLLDSALDPVIDDAVRDKTPQDAIRALRELKVIDPACGSGHFLIAAARRIGVRLAELEEETSQPSPAALRRATRTVIAHCIYGADINPVAVELAKVALWLESQDAGKPLAFLDHRLRVGNSLLGIGRDGMQVTETLKDTSRTRTSDKLTEVRLLGLPDDAYAALEGDDRGTVADLKKRNKQERKALAPAAGNQPTLLGPSGLGVKLGALNRIEPNTLQDVQAQESTFRAIEADETRQQDKALADAWCAAFVLPRLPGRPAVTTATLHTLQAQPAALPGVREAVRAVAAQYRFLHPHIEFPDVFTGERGGFDCVLGNPPWEHTELKEKEWFAARVPEIAGAATGAIRKRMIDELATVNPQLHDDFLFARREADAVSHFISASGRYPLTARGRINTYAIFSELCRQSLNPQGRMGIIVPSGIATDDTYKSFFQDITESGSLKELYFFNNKVYFKQIGLNQKLFVTLSAGPKSDDGTFFMACDVSTAEEAVSPGRRFNLSPAEIALLNPNTRTAPVFRTARDATITKGIYQRVPVLLNEGTGENPWGVSFKQGLFNMTSDSGLFRTAAQLEAEGWVLQGNHYHQAGGPGRMLPLYEAKLMHQFDHRYATYTPQGDTRDLTPAEKADPDTLPQPRYWVPEGEVEGRLIQRDRNGNITWAWTRKWLMGFRDITNATNERTAIFSPMPRIGVGNKAPITFTDHVEKIAGYLSCVSSFPFDFAARQKVGGTTMNFFLVKQFPVLPPSAFTPQRLGFITPRVLELTFTAHDLTGFARDLGHAGPPFAWDEERRFWLRAELDALYFLLYGLEPADVDYVMDTFPIVKRKDEAKWGTYRTKEAILSVYDELRALGLERLDEYRSRAPGGAVAGGWVPTS